jgi:DNA topoisomerase-3
MQKLLATGRTDLFTRFVSKKGRRFKAYLVKTPDQRIGFEFEPRAPRASAAPPAQPRARARAASPPAPRQRARSRKKASPAKTAKSTPKPKQKVA